MRDLENLKAIMVQANLDIAAFNQYVKGKHAEVHACSMTDAVTITHLLQGYKAAADKPFVTWIKHHHDNVDNGTTNFMAKQLMQMASKKHADMVANGTWARLNADQECLIVLNAKVNKLKKGFKKVAPKTDGTKKLNSLKWMLPKWCARRTNGNTLSLLLEHPER